MGGSGFWRRTWFWIFITGLLLFLATDWALGATSNLKYLPTVILIGATLVPVTFVVYIWEHEQVRDVPVPSLAVTFLWGGALGLVVAGVLEYQTARQMGALSMLGVGFIEEGAKLVFPFAFYLQGRYRSEEDGLLFGVTAGMGFAALETMGYGFVGLLQSRGNVDVLNQTLFTRGLLSPAGHAAWTGLVCAVLWRERGRLGHATLNGAVIGAFLLAVVLHSLWNILSSVSEVLGPAYSFVDFLGILLVGSVSLWLLIRRFREAHRGKTSLPQ